MSPSPRGSTLRVMEETREFDVQPWTTEELGDMLDAAALELGMARSEAVRAYEAGELPDTPAAFTVGTVLFLCGGVPGENGGNGARPE